MNALSFVEPAPVPPLDDVVRAGFPGWHARPRGEVKGTALFLHGAFTDHQGFGGYLQRFAAHGFDAYAFSRRGRRGVGPEGAAGLTFGDYLDDTRRVLETFPSPPIVVGHSLGGLIAQKLAEEGLTRAIVLVSSAPPSMLTAQLAALAVYVPNLPKIMTGRPFTVPAGGCARVALNRMPPETRARVHGALTPESGAVYRAMMFGTVRVDASRVRCPVWVGAGEEDRVVSTGLSRSIARHYKAPLKLYGSHAHWILEEPGWEVPCDDILGWIDSLPA